MRGLTLFFNLNFNGNDNGNGNHSNVNLNLNGKNDIRPRPVGAPPSSLEGELKIENGKFNGNGNEN